MLGASQPLHAPRKKGNMLTNGGWEGAVLKRGCCSVELALAGIEHGK